MNDELAACLFLALAAHAAPQTPRECGCDVCERGRAALDRWWSTQRRKLARGSN